MRFECVRLALAALLLAVFAVPSGGLCAKSGKGTALSPEEILEMNAGNPEAAVAALTDAQSREMLLRNLRAQARERESGNASGEGDVLLAMLSGAEVAADGLAARLQAYVSAAADELGEPQRIVDALSDGHGGGHLVRSAAFIALIVMCALGVLLVQRKAFDRFIRERCSQCDMPAPTRMRVILLQILFHSFSLFVYCGVYFSLAMAVVPDGSAELKMSNLFFVVLTYALLIEVFAALLLSPGNQTLRPLPLSDAAASSLYMWLMVVTGAVFILAVSSTILAKVGGAVATGRLLHASAGIVSGIILAAMILASRRRVAEYLHASAGEGGELLNALTRFWHYPALAYALFIGAFWSVRALSAQESLLRLVLSLFLIPLCAGGDMWVRRLLAMADEQDAQVVRLGPEDRAAEDERDESGPVIPRALPARKGGLREYIPLISRILRLILVVAPVFLMLRIWGVSIPMGWLFARNVMGVLLVIIGSLLFWEIIRIQIDRKLREEMALSGLDPDEMEEGGSGGSRIATLLVLLRKFVLTVIVVLGTLVTLSSMGVDIGPLIAGAGVFGLAIGFGAQTLVKDIISGVFFLMDDAFRVGDYVEAGTAKGTVEQISLRSMKLRHPRGMVYNVPYGSLKILQNFSRDYIISKLDFRIRYDADLDRIRKVIKRINKDLQTDEEYRGSLLSDIKSNGVRSMEDSAMILRVKFKTLPGHQFVMAKEVYRRVQEAFRKNGIEFAHRNVTVYFPPEVQQLIAREAEAGNTLSAAAMGGAAAAALLQEEEQVRAAALAAAKQGAEEE